MKGSEVQFARSVTETNKHDKKEHKETINYCFGLNYVQDKEMEIKDGINGVNHQIAEIESEIKQENNQQAMFINSAKARLNFLKQSRATLKKKLVDIDNDKKELDDFSRKNINEIDFSSEDALLKSIDFERTRYIELIAILEKAIMDKNYDFVNIKNIFLTSPSGSNMQLAIIESLSKFFSDSDYSKEARLLLKEVVTNFIDANAGKVRLKISSSDRKYVENYQTDYDEDYEYDIFMTTSIVNLARFGDVAENDLLNIFENNIREIRENAVKNDIDNIDSNKIYQDDFEVDILYHDIDIDRENDSLNQELNDSVDPKYRYNSRILDVLSEVGTRKSIDTLTNFIEYEEDSAFIYKYDLLRVFEKIDINYAVGNLLKLLKSSNVEVQRRAGKFLFNLEVGKIGISDEGVKYLEKIFDLGEFNNPNFLVNRLTADGDIGIFDEGGVLQKFFKVDVNDLISDDNIIIPEVLEFTYETLFFSKDGETEEERIKREKYLQEFKKSYFDFYDDEFIKRTGVRFNNLGFKEQGQFLIYYKIL